MIHYASFGRRAWATVLSLLVDLLVLWALFVLVADAEAVAAPFGFWYLLHHVGFVVEGGTLGHRLAGLRVVDTAGGRVGVPHAFVRELGRLFLSLPPLGLGFLWMLDERQRRTWHDLMAGSVVVREADAAELAAPAWAEAPPWRQHGEPSESRTA